MVMIVMFLAEEPGKVKMFSLFLTNLSGLNYLLESVIKKNSKREIKHPSELNDSFS